MREIHIHIGEVVLYGMAQSDPEALRAALEDELRALAHGHDGPYPNGHAARLEGQPVTLPADGAAVARSVWHGIVRPAVPGAAS
ncbi:hypothetical protein [Spongiactinospora sp. TRM90649]|uniref:hypothetical protein n=1 Tax=Spongiactinospora sp. TRM90649 TaxID=3031114 RepID=UPI0023F72A1B|nr:hypothetical protein [Spongiactinospora sp. TRM90649]MDF5753121.1 hypothetical protein [Spongiactinospora sp. TRM90649]